MIDGDTAKPTYDLSGKRVWVAGHRGLVGAALVRRLERESVELLTVGKDELDLRRQQNVENWMRSEKPDVVIMAAAKVGGIQANVTQPADFIYDNLVIETNIVHGARLSGVEKLLLLGSTCIYPKLAPQPIREEFLLTGPLEPTNQWYAVAKIAGIKLAQAYRRQFGCDFISAQPTNLYGPGDNFDLETSHVLPALLRKAHEAKVKGAASVSVWGSGTPLREFLHVDDLADALVFLIETYSDEDPVNVGSGTEITIADLARTILDVVGYRGELVFDGSKSDGTPRKLVDMSKLDAMGWHARIGLKEGLASTYEWFLTASK
ncbi:GDP-L-fucose synthase [Aureimonas leprariae]|uniref:GDP-L-fucose synthase n=1 Tax=Plantimonas leprariae TaxID=2615207 RepID=A0A7V7PQD0_9HYPH|nr:GDP-L-fucose synthase [Aureimonas leprariae]KAB0680347.1 GDP-L-fucose synthase [Aureimonas leprariae]